MAIKLIKEPIYEHDIYFIWKHDKKAILKFIAKFEADPLSKTLEEEFKAPRTCACTTSYLADVFIIIADERADINTVSHEAFHAVCRIMENCGIPLIRETEEVYAYLLGWLIQELCNKCKEITMATKKHPGFEANQKKIAKKEGVSMKAAGAIEASASRKASPKAKKANPRLNKVKG